MNRPGIPRDSEIRAIWIHNQEITMFTKSSETGQFARSGARSGSPRALFAQTELDRCES